MNNNTDYIKREDVIQIITPAAKFCSPRVLRASKNIFYFA